MGSRFTPVAEEFLNSVVDSEEEREIADIILARIDCDCVGVVISSKSCRKCGKTARITGPNAQEMFVHLTQLRYKLEKLIEGYDEDIVTVSQSRLLDEIREAMDDAASVARVHGDRLREADESI